MKLTNCSYWFIYNTRSNAMELLKFNGSLPICWIIHTFSGMSQWDDWVELRACLCWNGLSYLPFSSWNWPLPSLFLQALVFPSFVRWPSSHSQHKILFPLGWFPAILVSWTSLLRAQLSARASAKEAAAMRDWQWNRNKRKRGTAVTTSCGMMI